MTNNVMVSVCCTTYNHEKYIKEALESFVNQKTSFKYEILIHDDASTDKTKKIIREYEKKYPGLIKPIYQTENQYSKGISVSKTYLYPKTCGKYIALCEGDDYWKDEYKLQKQFDALERNPSCAFCTCIVEHIREDGESLQVFQPSTRIIEILKNQIITAEEMVTRVFEKNIIPFQSSSYFVRKDIMNQYLLEKPEFSDTRLFGDVPMLFYFVLQGDVYFIPEVMSCYREFSAGSWTNTHFKVKKRRINHYLEIINMLEKYDLYTNGKFKNSLEDIKCKYEFWTFELQGNYIQLLKRKYKNHFRERTLKEKIYIILHAVLQIFSHK